MDTSNWRPAQGGEPTMDNGDWRSQLQKDSRQRIVNKIMDTLKRHLPFSGQEGLQELKKIAVRFEEKIYTAATGQSDYLRKISLKMLSMENKSQNPIVTPGKNPPDPASHSMQPQVNNHPMLSNQSQIRQQLLPHNIQNNIGSTGVQGSSGLTSALPPVSSLSQSTMPNVVGQNSGLQNMQNISGVSQNMGNPMGQGSSNVFTNSQRQIPGRQQQAVSQQQQHQSQNPQNYLYQPQYQQQLMKHKFQQGSMPHSLMQSHIHQQQQQQQQQNLLQPTQLQTSQQPLVSLDGHQQRQQSSVQQPTQSMLQPSSQSVLRQHQQTQQAPIAHQQQTPMQQQSMLPTQQQQPPPTQMIGQQPNVASMQQNQLLGQQNQLLGQHNSIPDMQLQQQRLLVQQNNLSNLQQQQQQQMMGQQSNLRKTTDLFHMLTVQSVFYPGPDNGIKLLVKKSVCNSSHTLVRYPIGPSNLNFKRTGRTILVAVMVEAEKAAVYAFAHNFVYLDSYSPKIRLSESTFAFTQYM